MTVVAALQTCYFNFYLKMLSTFMTARLISFFPAWLGSCISKPVSGHRESDFFPKMFQLQLELPVQILIRMLRIQGLALGVFSPRPRALGKQESLDLAVLCSWRGGHEAGAKLTAVVWPRAVALLAFAPADHEGLPSSTLWKE